MEVFRNDVKAGVFILVGLGLFLYALFRVGGLLEAWNPGTEMQLHFQDAQQVEPGADVYFRGIKVGRIKALRLAEDGAGIVMTCKLQDGVVLHAGTTARVGDKSVLGGKMVELLRTPVPGETPEPLPAGAVIEGQAPGGLGATLELVNGLIVEYRDKLDVLVTKLDTLLDNLNRLARGADEGIDAFAQTKDDLAATLEAYRTLAGTLNERTVRLSDDVAQLLADSRGTLGTVREDVHALTTDLRTQITDVTTRVNRLLETSDALAGRADGMLAENRESLKQSLDTLARTLTQLESFSEQVAERPSSLVWKGRKGKK